MIYADNAATTKLDPDAFEAMKPYLLEEYGNASQLYSFSRKPKRALLEARESIAACIGALPDEVFFTSGGTESDNWAIKGSAFADADKKTTITSAFEHHAVLHACAAIEQLGYPVDYLLPSPDGKIEPETLKSHLSSKTRLVSIMLANNEIGSIQPVKELCKISHDHGAIFHTDAVQAVGHISIDVNDLGVDMLSASAHKFNGPKGVGFLYIRKGTCISSYADGGAQEYGFRAGTENVAGIVGMAVALSHNLNQLKTHQHHILELEQRLISGLVSENIQFIRNGGADTLPGILSLSFENTDGEALLHRLDLMGVAVATGSACDSKNTEISHVLKSIHLNKSLAKGTIRISLGKANTKEDVDIIILGLKRVLG